MTIGNDRYIEFSTRSISERVDAQPIIPPPPPPPVDCSYTLDPLSGPVFGQLNFPDSDGTAQTFGFNSDDVDGPFTILHTNAVGGDGLRTMSGIRAFEIPFSGPNSLPVSGLGTIGVAIHDITNAQKAVIFMRFDLTSVTLVYDAVVLATFSPATAPSAIGVYMDATTGKIGVTADGTDYGYQAGTPVLGIGSYYLRGVGLKGFDAGYTNKQFDSGIKSTGLTEIFPLGSLDMCGNAL